ncbi:MAG: Nramp family divalent metal transporter [Candidatus Curtissbacteria bacterium]|nr:Nramp family divalent metal transporter [Candidatus Curtissbacteria bacterium]
MNSQLKPYKIANLPPALPFLKILGPSFIILGLGLGSGEIILWPYLVSNFGLGIIWGAVLGITFQFFINMEIERYALVRGESIFTGFARLSRLLPIWFIASTFLGFGWPGIVAASAKIFSIVFKIESFHILAIVFLLAIGAILTLGPVLYKTVERFQKTVIIIGVPTLLIITAAVATKADYTALTHGVIGIGEGYNFLPKAIPLLTFLGAFAFSGAGGNLNLSQSIYIKEKGYGMGKYAHKIQSLLTGKVEDVELEGTTFNLDEQNMTNFKKWWKIMNFEHFFVFLLTGIISILLLALLAYSTTFGTPGNAPSIDFIANEARAIGSYLFPLAGTLFLVLTGTMLFATQFAVMDSTSRIISENIILTNPKKFPTKAIPKAYYITLWAQIIFGICIFSLGLKDPKDLIILQAVINAVAMFIHIGLTFLLNVKTLPKVLAPSYARRAIIITIFLFFGGFSLYSIWGNLI